MSMLKSENLLDHDGRWVTSEHSECFPPIDDLVSFDTCEEAISYARENPDECQTHVGRIQVSTPERLVTLGAIEGMLENAQENQLFACGDLDPTDFASWTPEDVAAIHHAVLEVVRDRGIVRPSYLVDSITETGVPDEFELADAAEGVA